RRMRQQYILDFRARYVVTGGDDHVVRAALEPIVAVNILYVSVASKVPTMLHVRVLVLFAVQVAAAGRTSDRKPPNRAKRRVLALLVDNPRLIAENSLAGRAGANVIT